MSSSDDARRARDSTLYVLAAVIMGLIGLVTYCDKQQQQPTPTPSTSQESAR